MYLLRPFHCSVFGTLEWDGSQLKLLATAAQLMGTVTLFAIVSTASPTYPNPPIFLSRLLGRLCSLPT